MKKEGTMSACVRCGDAFYRPPSHRTKSVYCSRDCHYAARGEQASTLRERFDSYVLRGDKASCWPWQASILKTGYGSIREGVRAIRAHRLAYEFAHGVQLRTSEHVLHSCDNRRCCNPSHLFLGTPKTNSDDKIAKRRHVFGEQHHSCKLTSDQVVAIKAAKKAGVTQRRIAEAFGISEGAVSGILSGRIRKLG